MNLMNSEINVVSTFIPTQNPESKAEMEESQRVNQPISFVFSRNPTEPHFSDI